METTPRRCHTPRERVRKLSRASSVKETLIMAHEGTRHFESSSGLRRGPYATRYRFWPPKGFKEPTREELATVLRQSSRLHYRNVSTADLVRWVQVIVWFGRTDACRSVKVYDFHHEINRELRSRKAFAQPLGIIRCDMCSHASERLWEITGETHNIVDRNDEPIKSAFLCARCWSDYAITEE